MEPTYEQIQSLIVLAEVIRDVLVRISQISLLASGWIIACLTWRNFILAKNQRSLV